METGEKEALKRMLSRAEPVVGDDLSQTWLDIGKDLLKSSISRGVDFHKAMLTLTATFTTLMATILGAVTINTTRRLTQEGKVISVPIPAEIAIAFGLSIILMLASAVVFALGYRPRTARINLGKGKGSANPGTVVMYNVLSLMRTPKPDEREKLIEEIQEAYHEAVMARYWYGVLGTALFALSIVSAAFGIGFAMKLS